MQRITQSQLEQMVRRINIDAGLPTEQYTNGKPNAGVYHLSYAYGGVALHRMSLKEGCTGVSNVSNGGHGTKRDLYNFLCGFTHEK